VALPVVETVTLKGSGFDDVTVNVPEEIGGVCPGDAGHSQINRERLVAVVYQVEDKNHGLAVGNGAEIQRRQRKGGIRAANCLNGYAGSGDVACRAAG